MELTSSISLKRANELFGGSNVTEKDLSRYTKLIGAGQEQEAIDEFISKYITPYVQAYQETAQDYIRQAEEGQLSQEENDKLEESLAILTLGITTLLSTNYNTFMDVLAIRIFEDNNIVTNELKETILKQTLAQFEQLTRGAMIETQTNVLNYIRTLQKEMIIENQYISRLKLVDEELASEIIRFKKSLQEKYPDLYKAMENGQILKSRPDASGNVINYKLDRYTEMSTRTTLLNVDRTAVEVTAQINGEEVVEYYKRDNRTVKEPRQICIDILSSKTNGKSLLALTQEAANKYGVLTIEQARANGAMGAHCRHSIRSI